MRNYVFWPNWIEVLMRIDGTTATEFCQEYRKTYAHIHSVTKDLQERGLIEGTKEGRKIIFRLTEKGRQMADSLKKADEVLRGIQSDEAGN